MALHSSDTGATATFTYLAGGRGLPRAGAMDTLARPPQEWSESSLLAEHSRLAPAPSIVVFSGGTAFNGVAADFKHLTHRVTHVLPVSDDGGSTAEIVRVLGGPAVGDIRSRCLRLAEEGDEEVGWGGGRGRMQKKGSYVQGMRLYGCALRSACIERVEPARSTLPISTV